MKKAILFAAAILSRGALADPYIAVGWNDEDGGNIAHLPTQYSDRTDDYIASNANCIIRPYAHRQKAHARCDMIVHLHDNMQPAFLRQQGPDFMMVIHGDIYGLPCRIRQGDWEWEASYWNVSYLATGNGGNDVHMKMACWGGDLVSAP